MTNENYQPSIAGIRAFVAIAEYQHFGTAAKKLKVTQPTLSQSLASLEQGLGVTLVERSTRRVEITEVGKRLLKKANSILESLDNLSSYAKVASSVANNVIKIGIIPTIAPYVIPDLIRTVSLNSNGGPKLQIFEDKTDQLIEQLKGGSLDVLLLALPLTNSSLTQIPLYKEEFYVVSNSAHKFGPKSELSLDELEKEKVILLAEGHCFRDQVVDICRLSNVKPDFLPSRAASLTTAVQCVAGNIGITFIPASARNVEIQGSNLVVNKIIPVAPTRTVGLVFKNTSSRTDQFKELAEKIKKLECINSKEGITLL